MRWNVGRGGNAADGSFLDATRAAALGFVDAVVPTADLEAAGAKTVAALLQAIRSAWRSRTGLQVGIDAPGIESAVANEPAAVAARGAEAFAR